MNIKKITIQTIATLLLFFSSLNILCMEQDQQIQMFTRNEGFWSNPEDENKKGFWEQLTEPKSQRENWYAVTPYIAEFLCTVSNVGFLYVGLQHNSPELIFAGIASILSHSIPKEWLLKVDKIGVALVLSKLIRNYATVLDKPVLLIPAALAGAINLADTYLARNKGLTWPHVVWHFSSAYLAHLFLDACE